MTPREILLAVLELLRDPARWTQGAARRDAMGRSVSSDHKAVSWCILGAVSKCSAAPDGGTYPSRFDAFRLVREACGGTVATFNDTHTHSEVVALLEYVCKYA